MSHIVSTKLYFGVFAALMVLTALTVAASRIDLGGLNVFVALVIAITKAVLVVLFFMHVRYSSRLTQLFVSAGFFWLVILLTLTLSDYLTRGQLSFPGGW